MVGQVANTCPLSACWSCLRTAPCGPNNNTSPKVPQINTLLTHMQLASLGGPHSGYRQERHQSSTVASYITDLNLNHRLDLFQHLMLSVLIKLKKLNASLRGYLQCTSLWVGTDIWNLVSNISAVRKMFKIML